MTCSSLERQDQTIYRGQTAKFDITVLDDDGERYVLTGATLTFTAKHKASDASPLFTLTTGAGIVHATQSGGTIGDAVVTLTAVQTALLTERSNVYDIWLTKVGGDVVPVVPLSTLTVIAPVWDPGP